MSLEAIRSLQIHTRSYSAGIMTEIRLERFKGNSLTTEVLIDGRIGSYSKNKEEDEDEEDEAPLQPGELLPFL